MKILTLIGGFSILLMIVILGTTAEEPSLVAYYPFDGNEQDASGNGNQGEINGGSKWVRGKFGEAIHLEPAAFIEMQANDSLHGDLFKADPFTISAWIQPNFEGSTWEHIWRSLPSDAGHNTLFLNKDQGLISWRGQVGGWTILCQTDPGIIEADEWTHVVVLGDSDKFKIYVNGEKVGETDFQETRGGNVTYRLGGSGGETFAGAIDEAAIFSRALDENEINLLNNGIEVFLPVEPHQKLATKWGHLKQLN